MPGKRANVKNEKQYEALNDKGMSKQRAARIANSPNASKNGGKKSGSAVTPNKAVPRRNTRRRVAREARRPPNPSPDCARGRRGRKDGPQVGGTGRGRRHF